MPFYLNELDFEEEASKHKSVLLVVCRFCPAASLALKKNRPYLEFLRRNVNTAVFEERIDEISSSLENAGLKTGVFRGNLLRSPFNFFICMWNERQREKLVQQAGQYEAVVVLGCEAAYENVRDQLKDLDCRVIKGMETEGVFSVNPRFHWPDSVSLELLSLTPMSTHGETSR